MACDTLRDRRGAHYRPGLRLTLRRRGTGLAETRRHHPPGKVMTDAERDYSATLFLPKTDFPMRAGLPQKEPELLARWQTIDLYGKLRAAARGRPKFVLHDGPPYAKDRKSTR